MEATMIEIDEGERDALLESVLPPTVPMVA
jgi:hypothetical protein